MKRCIFGAGKNGQILLNAAANAGIEIDCFIDDFSTLRELRGLTVCRSAELDPTCTEVFISMFQNSAGRLCSDILKAELGRRGFASVHTFEETFQLWPGVGKAFADTSYLWMRSEPSQMIDRERLTLVDSHLADQKSRTLFRQIIAFRESLDAAHYPMPENTVQYFPEDVPLFSRIDELRFIDGGAFTGDTLADAVESLRRQGKPVRAIASFEPDENNHALLQKEAAALRISNPNTLLVLYPFALWSHSETLSFLHDEQSSGSTLMGGDPKGRQKVHAVSIDETVFDMEPNYIKLDVEGAEIPSLQGATQTIAAFHPALAVCLYHRPQDLWEIPLRIYEICPDYKMYMRLYGHLGIELVLYCTTL